MINRNDIFCLLLQKNNQSVSRIDCGFLFLWLHLAVDVLFLRFRMKSLERPGSAIKNERTMMISISRGGRKGRFPCFPLSGNVLKQYYYLH